MEGSLLGKDDWANYTGVGCIFHDEFLPGQSWITHLFCSYQNVTPGEIQTTR